MALKNNIETLAKKETELNDLLGFGEAPGERASTAAKKPELQQRPPIDASVTQNKFKRSDSFSKPQKTKLQAHIEQKRAEMHVVANPAPTALQMKLQLKENIQNSQLSAKKEKMENKYFGLTNTPNDSKPRNNFNQNQSSSKKTSFSSGTDTPAFRGNRTLDNESIS